jgi:ABC-type polysaccharide transport system permease subunit
VYLAAITGIDPELYEQVTDNDTVGNQLKEINNGYYSFPGL